MTFSSAESPSGILREDAAGPVRRPQDRVYPQAKGKIERNAGTLQRRLAPPLIQAGVRRDGDCPAVVDPHVGYWNAFRENRPTGLTPDAAFALAAREGRVACRPCPPPKRLDLHIALRLTG